MSPFDIVYTEADWSEDFQRTMPHILVDKSGAPTFA